MAMIKKPFERIRELVALYWKPLLTLLTRSAIVWDVSKLVGYTANPNSSQNELYVRICIGLFIFIIIRFPRVAITITSWFIGSPTLPHPRQMIFRGPRPYGKQDGDVFSGREKEVEMCWTAVRENAFFVLEGESGC